MEVRVLSWAPPAAAPSRCGALSCGASAAGGPAALRPPSCSRLQPRRRQFAYPGKGCVFLCDKCRRDVGDPPPIILRQQRRGQVPQRMTARAQHVHEHVEETRGCHFEGGPSGAPAAAGSPRRPRRIRPACGAPARAFRAGACMALWSSCLCDRHARRQHVDQPPVLVDQSALTRQPGSRRTPDRNAVASPPTAPKVFESAAE